MTPIPADPALATLFHELRGPASTARAWLHVLKRDPPAGEQARRAIDAIDRQLVRLTTLLEDLLDMSRVREGKLHLVRTDLDLAQLARGAVEDQAACFETRGVELRAEIPVEPLRIRGDGVRLEQVVRNLLQNAAKFTPRGGRVLLQLEADGAARVAHLRLRDTGSGFDPALREVLFRPFEQAAATSAGSEGGLGLGLALVKALVELHGGTVEARSSGPGTGAEFVVHLPREPAPEAAAAR